MDDYKIIESTIAKKYGGVAKGTRKSIGDFLLNDDMSKPVNVKSNNLARNNYSPNMISAKRLINWMKTEGNELYFIFVDYYSTDDGVEIQNDSGLIPVQHLSWDCLTIEAQGWGVIQMSGKLTVDKNQDIKGFFSGMKQAYEAYMEKEAKKMQKIKDMIKDF